MYNTYFLLFSEYLVPLHVIHAPALLAITLLTSSLAFRLRINALTSLTLPNPPCFHSSIVYRLHPLCALWTPYEMSICRMQCHLMPVSKVYCMDSLWTQRCIKQSIFSFFLLYRLQYSFFFLSIPPFSFPCLISLPLRPEVPLFFLLLVHFACRSSPRFCDIVNVCLFSVLSDLIFLFSVSWFWWNVCVCVRVLVLLNDT